MSRRRPTQVTPPRPAGTGRATVAADSAHLPANLAALSEQWVRDICPTDTEHRAETVKRWRIATGQDSGNPEQTAGRSKVQRHQPDPQVPAQWRKEYQHSFGVYERHELMVLVQLWSAHAQDQRSPRDFHAQAVMLGDEAGAAVAAGPSRLQRLITKDVGPNLLSWEYFQPLTVLGPQQLAWPLFAHPLFLAAIAHRLLVAVEVLFAHKVVHLDLKPENIGLALPPLQPAGASTRLQGAWPLKALPLKLLDFEFSVHYGLSYPGMPPSNDYTSPFARQRLTVAAAHEAQSNAWAQAVDWGADLYALGCMLGDWVAWAQSFVDAYVRVQRNELGPLVQGQHLAALCQAQLNDLVWLEQFARKLQAQDRPADEALVKQFDLTARAATPLAHLRAELASRFAALQEGARGLDLPFWIQLPSEEIEKLPEPKLKGFFRAARDAFFDWTLPWWVKMRLEQFFLIVAFLLSLSPMILSGAPNFWRTTLPQDLALLKPLVWAAEKYSFRRPTVTEWRRQINQITVLDERFQILPGDEEVKDLKTGLIWRRCPNESSWDGLACAGEVSKSYTFLAARNLLGNSGWRLPTARELLSLRMCYKGFSEERLDLGDGGDRVPKSCIKGHSSDTFYSAAFPTRGNGSVYHMFTWTLTPQIGDLNKALVINSWGEIEALDISSAVGDVWMVREGQKK